MVSLNIFSALTISLISLTGASAITLQTLDKRSYENSTSCIATTETKTSYSSYTVYGAPYSGVVSNEYTTPDLESELEGSNPVFSIYVAQDFYNISDFSLVSTEVSEGLTLAEDDLKIYSGDVGNFVQISPSIFNIGSEANNSVSISLNGRTNDPLLRIDIPGTIILSEKAYSVSFLLVLDTLTSKLAKRDQLTFELSNTFVNPLYVSSTTSDATSSSLSSSIVAPSSQMSGISSTTSSALSSSASSSSTETTESSSISDSTNLVASSSSVLSTATDSTDSSASSVLSTATASTDSFASSSALSTATDSTEPVASSVSSTDLTDSFASSSVPSTVTDLTQSAASSSYITASSDNSSISNNDEEQSAVTAKSTITETITSCSNNACHTTTQRAIISDTTLTIDGTVTIVETTCPVSEDQTLSTFTESTTITEVVTSCSNNECSSFTWTAVPSSYTTTILDVVYTLTTYCPVGSNSVPSPAVNVGGGASVAVAAVSETITIGETETVISTICTLTSNVAVETYYTTTTAANGQVQGTAIVHTFSEFIANPSYSALENTITAVSPSTSTADFTQSSESSHSVQVYSENSAIGMNGQNSFTGGAIAAVIGLVMLL